jgi:hypothetical protein
MGQPVAVVEKASSRPGIVRFEANRNLTGMGHERFRSPADAIGDQPSAELARRMFLTGKVESVHIYLNVITVDLYKGHTADGLAEIVENLYIYWKPGMKPPTPDELMASLEPEGGAAAPATSGGDAPDAGGAAVDSRIPAALLEKSRLAKERAAAKKAAAE